MASPFSLSTVPDLIAAATHGAGYVPRDAFVFLHTDDHARLQVVSVVWDLAAGRPLTADDLVSAAAEVEQRTGWQAAALIGFGDTLDLSDPEQSPALDVLRVQVRDGVYRVCGVQQWQPVGISAVALEFPHTPAACRDDMLAVVAPGTAALPPVAALTVEQRRALEDEALAAAISDLPVATVAPLLHALASDVHVRDPWTARLMSDCTAEQRDRALRNVHAACAHYLPDPNLYGLAALLSWAIGGNSALALECVRLAAGGNSLALLVEDAVASGLPPSTWHDITCDIPLAVLRGGTTA